MLKMQCYIHITDAMLKMQCYIHITCNYYSDRSIVNNVLLQMLCYIHITCNDYSDRSIVNNVLLQMLCCLHITCNDYSDRSIGEAADASLATDIERNPHTIMPTYTRTQLRITAPISLRFIWIYRHIYRCVHT